MTSLYKKICILAPGRCGSTTLGRSLRCHPQIRCNHEELICQTPSTFKEHWSFLKKYDIDGEALDINNFEAFDAFKTVDMKEYLDWIFENEDLTRVLYYIYYWFPSIEDYLLSRDDILVVHLTRKNMIRISCSAENNESMLKTGKRIEDPSQWTKPVNEVLNQLRFWLSMERIIDTTLNHKMLKVYFEDMIADWDLETQRILQNTIFDPPVEMVGYEQYGTNMDIMPEEHMLAIHHTGLGMALLGVRT